MRALKGKTFNNVNVVVMIDGFNNGSSRYVNALTGETQSLGEVNTGAVRTLRDFVVWAKTNYPAQHYYLSIADHGRGTQGIAYDDSNRKDFLSPTEVERALREATAGAWKFDILHYDACTMGMLEDAYQVRDLADYFIAYENLGWSVFAYQTYAPILERGGTTGDIAVGIAQAYHLALPKNPNNVSAVDLSKVEQVRERLDDLSVELMRVLPTQRNTIVAARKATQKFDSTDFLYLTTADEYSDLRHFAEQVALLVPDAQVKTRAQVLMAAIDEYVLISYNMSGQMYGQGYSVYNDLSHSSGVAIYLPNGSTSQEYRPYCDDELFTMTADSSWDEFLDSLWLTYGVRGQTDILPPEIPPMLLID